jgi:hypothetical protein
VLEAPLQAQQQNGQVRVSRLLLIILFENSPAVLEARMSLKLQPTAEAYLIMARPDLAENKSAQPRRMLTCFGSRSCKFCGAQARNRIRSRGQSNV